MGFKNDFFFRKSTSGKGTVVPFPIAQIPSEEDIVADVPEKSDAKDDLLEQLEELNICDAGTVQEAPESKHVMNASLNAPKKKKRETEARDGNSARIRVETCLEEWFTIDTFRSLFGDEHVKEVLTDEGCTLDKIVSTLGDDTFENPWFKEQYIQLCRNLDMREKQEEKVLGDETGKKNPCPWKYFSLIYLIFEEKKIAP